MSCHFVKTTDDTSVDYLFHELNLELPRNSQGWRANSNHLCIKDMYNVAYEFRFAGIHLSQWSLAYRVQGPHKDYTINGRYRR